MLEKLLNCPKHPEQNNYQYLPVSTSYRSELTNMANKIVKQAQQAQNTQKVKTNWGEFIPNQSTQNIQNELVLLKLKGYIDPKDITGKNTQIKKLPKKVQVGTMIEGQPIVASKIRNKKKQASFADYFLKMDREKQFTTRKFTQLQRLNQRKRKLKKKIIAKKQGKGRK